MFSTNKKTGQTFNGDKRPEGPKLSTSKQELTEKEKNLIEKELKQEKKKLQEESERLRKLKKQEDRVKKQEQYQKRLNAIKVQKAKVRKEIALLHGIYEHRVSVDNLDNIQFNNSNGKVRDRGSAISLIGL